MTLREATIEDIDQMHVVRTSVYENQLSNPNLIKAKDYEDYLVDRGKGWVAEIDNLIVGFAIIDLIENNVWALFIQPSFERMGIGKMLHDEMINWYFTKADKAVWLSTTANTRAEYFYRIAGWEQTGTQPNGEIKFEMKAEHWRKVKTNKRNN